MNAAEAADRSSEATVWLTSVRYVPACVIPSTCQSSMPWGDGGAGAVGITSFTSEAGVETYLVAVFDNGRVDFYL